MEAYRRSAGTSSLPQTCSGAGRVPPSPTMHTITNTVDVLTKPGRRVDAWVPAPNRRKHQG